MSFRFSPRPNQAREINWRAWGAEAFAEAASADKPILLNLTAVWCHWCHLMDETTYSQPDLIELINENLIAVRVDADQHPHVQDRYIAGGWPTNAFLTPTGEVLWSGTYVPAEQFAQVAGGVLSAWGERRDELKAEIDRRRKALDAARGRHHVVGLVRREAADDVLSATIDAYDARNGGFGTAPKFPYVDAIELLLVLGTRDNADYLRMAEHSLEGMLAGELWDHRAGGFHRYSTAEDWTSPREEKLLTANAAMLRIYALAGSARARSDWMKTAHDIVAWVDATLLRADGLWAGNDAQDDFLYTNYNAQWIRALAFAGGRLQNQAWITTARRALDTLGSSMGAPGNVMFHFRAPGAEPRMGFLLADAAETARACVAVAQATGDTAYLEQARKLAAGMEQTYWAEDGGFWDRSKGSDEIGAMRYREKPFDLNADCARLLNELAAATGERGYRAQAERILALLSPQAGRYGVAGASYALAVDEFFEQPPRVVVVGEGPGADALRTAALALPLMNHRVWSMPQGGRVAQQSFDASSQPVAYVATSRGVSQPVQQPERLREVVATIR